MDYSTLDVSSNDLVIEQALLVTLRQSHDQINQLAQQNLMLAVVDAGITPE